MRRALIGVSAAVIVSWLFPTWSQAKFVEGAPNAAGWTHGDQASAAVLYGEAGQVIASVPIRTSGGRAQQWICRYYTGALDPSAPPLPTGDSGVRNPVEYNTYGFECRDRAGTVTHQMEIIPVYDPGDPFAPLAAVAVPTNLMQWVARQATTVGGAPALVTSPPAGDRQITGIETWFWVGDTWERPAAVERAAGCTATVSVKPVGLTIDPGDGGAPIQCTQQQVIAWQKGLESTECGHMYHRRSTDPLAPGHRAPGVYRVTATLTYTANWGVWEGDVGTGVLLDGGDLGTITSAPSVTDLTVHSAEAIIR